MEAQPGGSDGWLLILTALLENGEVLTAAPCWLCSPPLQLLLALLEVLYFLALPLKTSMCFSPQLQNSIPKRTAKLQSAQGWFCCNKPLHHEGRLQQLPEGEGSPWCSH